MWTPQRSSVARHIIYDWSGDGTGILTGNTIVDTYRKFNSARGSTGYYPASRVRVTLVGTDSYTNSTVAGEDTLDMDTCLLSCFPASLQAAIVPKVVGSYSTTRYTTCDKFWLFSGNELWGDNAYSNEGSQYEYLSNNAITTSNYSLLTNYDETGSAYLWWTRTINASTTARYVNRTGGRGTADINTNSGLSPGFCIE